MKVKNVRRADVVVGGWTPGEGGARRPHRGARDGLPTTTASCATPARSAPASPRPSSTRLRACSTPLARDDRPFTGRQPPSVAPASSTPSSSPSSSTATSPTAGRCATRPTRACATTCRPPPSASRRPRRAERGASSRAHVAGVVTGYDNLSSCRDRCGAARSPSGSSTCPSSSTPRSRRKTVRFHQLNGETGNRIAQKRVDSVTGEEVAYENIVKGYELTKDRYVVITPGGARGARSREDAHDRHRGLRRPRGHRPDLLRPPVLPRAGQGRGEGLRAAAERDAGVRQGRDRARRAALQGAARRDPARGDGDVLMMETMIFADEVVPHRRPRRRCPTAKELKVSDRELKMAQQLIDSLSTDFEPEKYQDEYREKVLELIERKAAGEEIASQPEAPEPAEGARPDGRARGEPRRGQGPEAGESNGEGDATKPSRRRRQEVVLARQGRREEVDCAALHREALAAWLPGCAVPTARPRASTRRRRGQRLRLPTTPTASASTSPRTLDAHRRARHPAGLEGRVDLPVPQRPPAGDRDRRRRAQAVPLPRRSGARAATRRSSTR